MSKVAMASKQVSSELRSLIGFKRATSVFREPKSIGFIVAARPFVSHLVVGFLKASSDGHLRRVSDLLGHRNQTNPRS